MTVKAYAKIGVETMMIFFFLWSDGIPDSCFAER